MFNWSAFTLFLYILMRMSGFVLFSPLYGRSSVPGIVKAGYILMLSVAVYGAHAQSVAVPENILEFFLHLLLELSVGFVLAMIMRFFFTVADLAGEPIDTQMGMSMGRTYDPGSQASMTNTASIMSMMMMLLFFAANGHITMLRVMLTSGEIVPFGQVALNENLPSWMLQLFAECALLAVKLCLPVLAAELMGQVGMGVLMKVIPQINVFAINIEFKVLVGLAMLLMLMVPISNFMLELESNMLERLHDILQFFNG